MTPPASTYPGVYVEETPTSSRVIEGVGTSVAAFVGRARRGPVDDPVLVGSMAEFSEVFGDAAAGDLAALALGQFFENGGSAAYFVRVAARAAGPAILGDAKRSTGVHALPDDAGIGLLVVPELALLAPADARKGAMSLLSFCEGRGIFCILDVPGYGKDPPSVDDALRWAASIDTAARRNGAVYFPFVQVDRQRGKSESIAMPAGGAVAGVFARTDSARGVWKAPAGVEASLHGVRGLVPELTGSDAERLRAGGINPIRLLPGAGAVVWGARTLDAANAATEWRYVNVRRLLLFLEKSIARGLQWAVFEPNGEALRAQIRLSVGSFLHHAFRAGALAGSRPGDAYFVRCEPEGGTVVVEFGVAPLRPAEFIVGRTRIEVGGTET